MKLEVGATASRTKTFTDEDVRGFAQVSGDDNPLHLDADSGRVRRPTEDASPFGAAEGRPRGRGPAAAITFKPRAEGTSPQQRSINSSAALDYRCRATSDRTCRRLSPLVLRV